VAGSAEPIVSRHRSSVPAVCFRGKAPTACGLPPGVVVARFHRGPQKTWRDRLSRLYPATATRCPLFALGVSPLRPLAYPRALSVLVFIGAAENVAGSAEPIVSPPPLLGARCLLQGLHPYGLRPTHGLGRHSFCRSRQNVAGSAAPIVSRQLVLAAESCHLMHFSYWVAGLDVNIGRCTGAIWSTAAHTLTPSR